MSQYTATTCAPNGVRKIKVIEHVNGEPHETKYLSVAEASQLYRVLSRQLYIVRRIAPPEPVVCGKDAAAGETM